MAMESHNLSRDETVSIQSSVREAPSWSTITSTASTVISEDKRSLGSGYSESYASVISDEGPDSKRSSVRLSGSMSRSRHSSRRASSFDQRRSRSLSSKGMGFNVTKNPLDDMSNQDLVNAVQELQKNIKNLELENMVFQHFLEDNDPIAIEGMESSIKNAEVIQERASISMKRLTITRHSGRGSSFLGSTASFAGLPAGISDKDKDKGKEGPRINITQKTDLILRHMDDIQASLEKLSKKCHAIRHKLKAELEEMDFRETEIDETMNTFANVFILGTETKYPQKNPAERFARFMNECFKQNRLTRDKLRLRTSSLKVQYQKLSNMLAQKRLLGENLQEVDFEQLQIANRRLTEKIDKRNHLLLELKKMNGHANLLLSRTKKNLLKKMEELKEIRETIAYREELIVKMDEECEKVSAELEKAKDEYDRIKIKSENYEVPDILDYVKKKAELGTLKKNLKIWARRKQIKDMALSASIRAMRTSAGTGRKAVPVKKVHGEPEADESDTFQFIFEKKQSIAYAQRREKLSKRRLT